MGKAYGFRPDGYNQIVIFDNEADFKAIMSANPDMVAIMGADGHTKRDFPGVYIAGVKASSHAGK